MVDEAAKDPDMSRALIENEGLRRLGSTKQNVQRAEFRKLVCMSLPHLETQLTARKRDDCPISIIPTMMQVPHEIEHMPVPSYREGGQIKSANSKGSGWLINKNFAFISTEGLSLTYGVMRVGENAKPDDPTEPTITTQTGNTSGSTAQAGVGVGGSVQGNNSTGFAKQKPILRKHATQAADLSSYMEEFQD